MDPNKIPAEKMGKELAKGINLRFKYFLNIGDNSGKAHEAWMEWSQKNPKLAAFAVQTVNDGWQHVIETMKRSGQWV